MKAIFTDPLTLFLMLVVIAVLGFMIRPKSQVVYHQGGSFPDSVTVNQCIGYSTNNQVNDWMDKFNSEPFNLTQNGTCYGIFVYSIETNKHIELKNFRPQL